MTPQTGTVFSAKKALLWLFCGCLILALFAFGGSVWHGFAPVDDGFLVYRNLATRGFTPDALQLAFSTFDPELYIPATLVSFQFNYVVSGLSPWSYHLLNVVLHALNAALVAWTALLLTRRIPAAFIAGVVFAVHPLHTEAVVWITGRKDLLFTAFFLASFVAYLHYRGGSRRAYVASLLAFLLSLLSKASAVTLPAALLLVDLLIERRPLRGSLIDKIPYAALSIIFMIIATFGKERILAQSGILETAIMAARSTVFYLWKFALPFNLTVFYPHNGPIDALQPVFLVSIAACLLLIGVIWHSWRRQPGIAFGLLFFLATLSPTFLNFRKGLQDFFAVDRYAYLPSVGLILLLAWLLSELLQRRGSLKMRALSGVALTAALIALSILQTRTWETPHRLFSRALTLYPASIPARQGLAAVLLDEGKPQEAFDVLKEGLAFGDDARLHLQAGYVYARTGNVAEARQQFQTATTMDPTNPDGVFALASLDEQAGNLDGAVKGYATAIDLDPSYVAARTRIAAILRQRGMLDDAKLQLAIALQWNPSSSAAHREMALLLEATGDSSGALLHAEKAASADPDDQEATQLFKRLSIEPIF